METYKNKMENLKVGMIIQHPKVDWGNGLISSVSNNQITAIFEKVGEKTLSLEYVKPIVLNENSLSVKSQLETRLVKTQSMERIYINEMFIDIHQDVKSRYPVHLVFIQNGYYFEVLLEDAEYCNRLYGWTIYERQQNVPMTGFTDNVSKIWNELKSLQKPYIVVSQIEKGKKPQRKITEIFP